MKQVLVVGTGSIGRRHIQCLKELGVPDVFVCEPVEENANLVRSMFDIRGVFNDLSQALEHTFDGAIICVPNHVHAAVAVPVIERGIPVLLEKPIEVDLAAAHRIQKAIQKNAVVCQIGYCLRFSTAMEKIYSLIEAKTFGKVLCADVTVGQYLPDWRPGVDYRTIYSAIKRQGGGVCLDISHELDYFRWLFGEPVTIQSDVRKISQLEINVEDVAETIVYTASGVLGRIHLDYLSRATRRQLYIVGENGNLQYDFITGMLQIYEAGNEFWKQRTINEDRNIMFKKQLEHFMSSVRKNAKPLIDVDDAIKTLEFAFKIRESFKG